MIILLNFILRTVLNTHLLLHSRCVKPLKPALTVQVATDTATGKVEPIPIVSAAFIFKEELRIAYGTGCFLAFENVVSLYFYLSLMF